jgi:hypothetical protein
MYAFLAILLLLLLIFYFYKLPKINMDISGNYIDENKKDVEGFIDGSRAAKVESPWAYSNIVAPASVTPPVISPPPVRNEGENPSSYKVPGKIPNAPYEQIARNDPRPYSDPREIKTNLPRIKEIAERLRGFLSFQAQLISDSSDPNIQLPLTQARADLDKLDASINVYERNPGIKPSESEQLMNEIEDNLWYLQNQVYKIQGLSPNQGTPAPLKPSVYEGFTSQEQPKPQIQNSVYSQISTVSNKSPADASQPLKTKKDPPATVKDLKEFLQRINTESKQLSSTGSTDPILSARLNGLDRIRNDVQDILNQINNKQMSEDEIPITKKEIENSLIQINKGQIPSFISTNMSNTLPASVTQIAMTNIMPNIPNQEMAMAIAGNPLAKRILDNTTISVGINYNDNIGEILNTVIPGTVPNNQEEFLDYSLPPVPGDTLPPPRTLFVGNVPDIKLDPHFSSNYQDPENRKYIFKGMTELDGKVIKTIKNTPDTLCRQECNDTNGCLAYSKRFGNNSPQEPQSCKLLATVTSLSTDPYTESGIYEKSMKEEFVGESSSLAPFNPNIPKLRPEEARLLSGLLSKDQPGHFDWKERSKHIGNQIRKRGLDIVSFGVHEPGLKVSKNYSWKGYAKMLCSRLEATMETGTAQACGCPPFDWKGW